MKVYLAIAASIFSWANTFLVVHEALKELTPGEIVLLRFLPVAIGYALYAFVFLRKETLIHTSL